MSNNPNNLNLPNLNVDFPDEFINAFEQAVQDAASSLKEAGEAIKSNEEAQTKATDKKRENRESNEKSSS